MSLDLNETLNNRLGTYRNFEVNARNVSIKSDVFLVKGDLVVTGKINGSGLMNENSNENMSRNLSMETLSVSGSASLNGGLTMDNNKFAVANDTGDTTIAGTLGVSGPTSLDSLTAGLSTLASATITNNATVGGTLGVTGDTNLVNATISGSLNTTNVNIAGTLGVSGATTFGSLTAGVTTLASAAVKYNATVGGTFGVTGNTNLVNTNVSGSLNTSTLKISGTAITSSASDLNLFSGKSSVNPVSGNLTTDRYIPLEINGTTYYLLLASTLSSQ